MCATHTAGGGQPARVYCFGTLWTPQGESFSEQGSADRLETKSEYSYPSHIFYCLRPIYLSFNRQTENSCPSNSHSLFGNEDRPQTLEPESPRFISEPFVPEQ